MTYTKQVKDAKLSRFVNGLIKDGATIKHLKKNGQPTEETYWKITYEQTEEL